MEIYVMVVKFTFAIVFICGPIIFAFIYYFTKCIEIDSNEYEIVKEIYLNTNNENLKKLINRYLKKGFIRVRDFEKILSVRDSVRNIEDEARENINREKSKNDLKVFLDKYKNIGD